MARTLRIKSVQEKDGGQLIIAEVMGDVDETSLVCKCQLPATERPLTRYQVASLMQETIDERAISLWEKSSGQMLSSSTFGAFLRELLGRRTLACPPKS